MGCPFATRRGLLGAAIGLAGVAATRTAAAAEQVPFHGANQAGIATPVQAHTYFAAFDAITTRAVDLAPLLQRWTEAAARLTQGLPVQGDSGDAVGLAPGRLTITFGFGPSLFDGRFGLAGKRPAALVDLPVFVGDQLVPERTGGDFSVQACSDDQQVAMHAVRQIMRLGSGVVAPRWVQAGFQSGAAESTPRNLMGFKDGTANPDMRDAAAMAEHVWVGEEGGWMQGGSYLVARPIRIALEHWDQMKLAFQEQTVGRHKDSGAPIGGSGEFDDANYDAADADGNPVIAENAHIRLAAPVNNDGATILRRGYSYDNGLSMVAERWPPWRHQMELDAGLLFICYQRNPSTGFIRIFEQMAKFDMLNQFVTHVGGGLFACPPAATPGGYVGQGLLAA